MAFSDIPIRVNNRLQFITAEWFNTIRTAGIEASAVQFQETPTGTVNGVNKDFDISSATTNEDSIFFYINGILLKNTEYSYSFPTITLTVAPVIGQEVYVTYNKTA